MQCTRCAGMRVSEIIAEGMTRVLAMRCVHCGDVTDNVIITNRQRHWHAPLRRRQPLRQFSNPRTPPSSGSFGHSPTNNQGPSAHGSGFPAIEKPVLRIDAWFPVQRSKTLVGPV